MRAGGSRTNEAEAQHESRDRRSEDGRTIQSLRLENEKLRAYIEGYKERGHDNEIATLVQMARKGQDLMSAENASFRAERDALVLENARLVAGKDALSAENENLKTERDALVIENVALVAKTKFTKRSVAWGALLVLAAIIAYVYVPDLNILPRSSPDMFGNNSTNALMLSSAIDNTNEQASTPGDNHYSVAQVRADAYSTATKIAVASGTGIFAIALMAFVKWLLARTL